jgi:hypothetical protein
MGGYDWPPGLEQAWQVVCESRLVLLIGFMVASWPVRMAIVGAQAVRAAQHQGTDARASHVHFVARARAVPTFLLDLPTAINGKVCLSVCMVCFSAKRDCLIAWFLVIYETHAGRSLYFTGPGFWVKSSSGNCALGISDFSSLRMKSISNP